MLVKTMAMFSYQRVVDRRFKRETYGLNDLTIEWVDRGDL